MDRLLLLNHAKARLRKLLLRITPHTHFIPKRLRNWASQRLLGALQGRVKAPSPFVPGLYEKGVNLFGFFKAENGLAQATKLYARALEESGLPHALIHTNFLFWLPQNDASFDDRLSPAPRYAVNLIHINPDQWASACGLFPRSAFDGRYNIGVWLWELETIPAQWHATFPYVSELWAPSRFVADALRKASPVPVTVMPYGVEVPVDESLTRADFGLPEDKFLVLVMYDVNSFIARKNPMAAIQAFYEAYGPQPEKAHLVLKINNPNDDDLSVLRGLLGEEGTCTLIAGTFEKPRVNRLIQLCDVYISLHRSEGFGLVMAEAMALGLPVVATNWSANCDFMSEEVACMVDYDLVPVGDAYQWGEAGQRWAEPHVDHAAQHLRRLAEDPAYYERKRLAGQRHILEHFSVERTAELMKARVAEILSAKG